MLEKMEGLEGGRGKDERRQGEAKVAPFFWTEFNNGYCILTNLGEEEHIFMS